MILVDRENQFLTLGIDGDAPLEQIAECLDFTIHPNAPDAAAADAREQASQEEMRSRMGDPNIGRRPTYAEYVQDLIRVDEMNRSEDYTPPIRTYAFYDLDGNGTEELLIFSDDLITSVVGMKNGLTYEGNDLILFGGLRRQTLRGFFDKLKAPNRVLSHSLLNIQRKIKIMVWL